MTRPFSPTMLLTIVLATFVLAACAAGVRDLEGRRIGTQDWQPVVAADARLSIDDSRVPVLSRERLEFDSRYLERWSLAGGHLFYEALNRGGFGPESRSPAYLHRLYGDALALRRQGVRITHEDIRVRRNLTFVVAHSSRVTCFVFVSVFGESEFADSPGNRLLRGGFCRPAAPGEPSPDDPDIIGILGTLRVEGAPVLAD